MTVEVTKKMFDAFLDECHHKLAQEIVSGLLLREEEFGKRDAWVLSPSIDVGTGVSRVVASSYHRNGDSQAEMIYEIDVETFDEMFVKFPPRAKEKASTS